MTDISDLQVHRGGAPVRHRSAASRTRGPVCVAVLSRSDVTRSRVHAVLADFDDRVTFVDHHATGPSPRVTVAVFELTRGDRTDLRALEELASEPLAVVAMVSPRRPDLAARSFGLGAHACVSTDIDGPELVDVIEAASGHPAQTAGASPVGGSSAGSPARIIAAATPMLSPR